LSQLGLNLGYLLVQIFCFFIIFVVVRAWIVLPLQGLLKRRRATLTQGLEDARLAAEARANAEKEADKVLADAQVKANQVVREATERAENTAKEIRSSAETDATKARAEALAEVEGERARILSDLRSQVAALAIAASRKMIGEGLDVRRQHALITEFFSGIKSGKVVILEAANLSGDGADVTSALPLTPEEQETVKSDILMKMGMKQTPVSFRVDPSILGGLVIRVGDKVLDGSVAGKLEDLRQSLT
jgi:F-type H+-transporting ATPase subunit b